MYQTGNQPRQEGQNNRQVDQNRCANPLYSMEVLLLLLVLGFIIYKLMNPMSSMNTMKSCVDLDLTATPIF